MGSSVIFTLLVSIVLNYSFHFQRQQPLSILFYSIFSVFVSWTDSNCCYRWLWSEPFFPGLGLWPHIIKYTCNLLSGLRCSIARNSGFFLFGSRLDLQYLSALCPMLLWHLLSLQGINKALSTLSHLVYLCTADNTGHTLMDLGKKRWAQCIVFPCFWKAFYQSEGRDDPISSV